MRSKGSLWFWRLTWAGSFLLWLGLAALYTWLPADGATGDLESFRPEGFHVQWLLEQREDGLQVGDVIVRGGGHTVEEWLDGAPRGPEWRAGGVVAYEILRAGQPMTPQIQLAPVPFRTILARWAAQLVIALAFLAIGAFVFWRRPEELAARLLMLFCIVMALQYWGDAFNFQYATLPWRWPFWIQLTYEHVLYGLSVATICYFALIFPMSHPLIERFPRLVPSILYLSFPLAILGAMALSPTWSAALKNGNHASWIIAIAQIGLALAAGIRSTRTARDPVARAQVRWIVWCAIMGTAVLLPGYVLPLIFTGHAFLPHPLTMIIIALVPFALGVAILRFRLFDIDVLINRTLVYGTLTVLLAALYLLVVWVLTLVIEVGWQGKNDTLVLFIATACIALAFAPLRDRVQALIDRTFYRVRLDYERLLPEMSERLATSIVPDQLAELLTKELPQQLQIAWATLAVLDSAGEHLVPAGSGQGQPTLPVDHRLITYLRGWGQPLLRLQPPPALPPEVHAFLEQYSIELSIPLIVGTEQVGLYNLGPKLSGDAYSGDEVRLLHLLGQQAAVAVENSRLFQAEREQRELTEALQEAADVVSSTLDLDQVLDHILEQVERVVAGDAFSIMLVESGIARMVRSRGYEQLGAPIQITTISMPITIYPTLTRMMQTGEPIIVRDTAADPDWVSLEDWEGALSYLAAPIRVAGHTVGFLNVDGTRPDQFSAADAHRLEALAHHAATALENARLYAETQRQLGEQTALREAGSIISSTLDSEAVLSRIAQAMARAIDATSAYISSYEPETRMATVLAEYIGPEACPAEQVSDLGATYEEDAEVEWLEMMKAGRHDITHIDSPSLTESERAHMQQYGAQTILYIPLQIKGRFIGYAELWESRRRRDFTSEEISLCQDIAQQAAIALENARLYEQAQQEITERKKAEKEIKASLEEKEVLLKEIHHRVKNNLQVISSLLYLQSKQVKDKDTLKMFQETQQRVRSMGLIHERLYQTEDLAKVDYASYVRDLMSHLRQSYGASAVPIKLNVDVDDISLGLDMAVPCGLIIHELVSNSLKHAFPNGQAGETLVRLRVDQNGQYTLVVRDDGVGFPEDLEFQNTRTLGLRLINTLVSQLEGTIELDRDGGTSITITFTAQAD